MRFDRHFLRRAKPFLKELTPWLPLLSFIVEIVDKVRQWFR